MNALTNQFQESGARHSATDTVAAPSSVPTDGRGGQPFDAPFHAPSDAALDPITISLVGVPQGKGRARACLRGGHIGHYTPEKTRTYEGMIRSAAMDQIGTRPAFDCPVEFVLRAIFPVPASWSAKKRQQALTGEIKPGKKPDLDNIAKAWNDGLNSVAYRDDALICRMTLDKRYGPQALVVVTVRPIA